MSKSNDAYNPLSYFENTTGLLVTFISIVVGCYFFVYLPKQYEIKEKDHRRMGEQQEGNSIQGLKNAAVGAGVEKVRSCLYEARVHRSRHIHPVSAFLDCQQTASIMSPPSASLAAPKSDPISIATLSQHDGSDPNKPIYLAIKGTVFDVTAKKEMYGPGGSYNIFAGKDGSVGLGTSRLPSFFFLLLRSSMW